MWICRLGAAWCGNSEMPWGHLELLAAMLSGVKVWESAARACRSSWKSEAWKSGWVFFWEDLNAEKFSIVVFKVANSPFLDAEKAMSARAEERVLSSLLLYAKRMASERVA